MDIKSLIPMVGEQVNQGLLHSLNKMSQVLLQQSRDFQKAFDFSEQKRQESRIVCFYETKSSKSAIKVSINSEVSERHILTDLIVP
jgi:hypothetical protein